LNSARDSRWSKAVAAKYDYRCPHCDSEDCSSAHLIPRSVLKTRYLLENGLYCCHSVHSILDEKPLDDPKRKKVLKLYVGLDKYIKLDNIRKNKLNIEEAGFEEIE
jgi:predicted restriction endonuclease